MIENKNKKINNKPVTSTMKDRLPSEEQIKSTQILPNEINWLNIIGFIRTKEEVPSTIPQTLSDQLVIVRNGGSTRAYLYDTTGITWNYVALS